MGCQKWLRLCTPIVLAFSWRSRWCAVLASDFSFQFITTFTLISGHFLTYLVVLIRFSNYLFDLFQNDLTKGHLETLYIDQKCDSFLSRKLPWRRERGIENRIKSTRHEIFSWLKLVKGTIHILRQHTFWTFSDPLNHQLCQHKCSTERQQNWLFCRTTHPVLLLT